MGCDIGESYSLPLLPADSLPFARHYVDNVDFECHLLPSMLLKLRFGAFSIPISPPSLNHSRPANKPENKAENNNSRMRQNPPKLRHRIRLKAPGTAKLLQKRFTC